MNNPGKSTVQLSSKAHSLAIGGMGEGELGGMEEQPRAAQLFAEEAVMAAFTVIDVPSQRVEDMFEVAADLVAAAGKRFRLYQRVAAGRVAADGKGEFDCCQAAIGGDGSLRLLPFLAVRVMAILLLQERVVDDPFRWCNTPADGKVSLAHLAGSERGGKYGGIFRGEGKKEYAGGRFVQAMNRIDPLSKQVTSHLESKAGLGAIDIAAVYQQSCRLVEDGDPVVTVNQG